ncbi:MAG: helix-turn-helix transcriptional regulator [Euryhalocaulis sp.]|uniref:helix-turn-helix domain-containing protein n=1 Tax=Euryhalocaulis sp. TaxID=2744307 RepID=UPI0017A681EE|nr:XRE family transcriptional regulator [Euryhalocaulis sp.]MBA4800487.1 helix-turn-helix transcriptional regulator [Euryhalocaulis sp.]
MSEDAESRATLGTVVRDIRKRNGWTLKEMSAQSGIPLSTLSKIEHDRLTLTYDKLQQLSQRLSIPMSDLFSTPPESAANGAITGRKSKGTMDDALRVETPNYDYYYLCTDLRKKRMIPIMTKVRAKSIEEFGELVRHAGEEYIFVLEGVVEVHTEFYDPVILRKWESFYIDSNMGHAYIVGEGEEAMIMGVCGGSGDIHLETLLQARRMEAERKAEPVSD